eukprot:Gregarina_sp_Poly_1__1975@NODE_1517_length_3960_cov_125_544567_g1005_i0_p4_GENE_NODE_1517_length_3960_cov_125_544567_g1005_i0NODE_1517_length_3960_cov_125_544567_g1005_i0_p4_ORF_typecomplete_len122_score10_73_NODE_1517_length_3960_cov_125_544567_g1005_i016782043
MCQTSFGVPEAQLTTCDSGVVAGFNSSLSAEVCKSQCTSGGCDTALSFVAIARCLDSNWIQACAFEFEEGLSQSFRHCTEPGTRLVGVECLQDLVPLHQAEELWLTLESSASDIYECIDGE